MVSRANRVTSLRVDDISMALITLRVLDGADRGRVYEELPTPVTIGREEGNRCSSTTSASAAFTSRSRKIKTSS